MEDDKELGKLEEVSAMQDASFDDLLGETASRRVILKSINKVVEIRPLKVGDLAEVSKIAKGESLELAIGIVFRGLLIPKMDYAQVRKLDPMILLEITSEISDLSGFTKEAVESAKNLLEATQPTPSGS